MNKFMLSERFRLELHWNKAMYDQDGVAKLEGAYFSGPVMREVEEINVKDFMTLDFVNQYLVFTKNFYVAILSWDGVRRVDNRIYLSNVELKNKHINSVPKLKDDDYIVVDTKNHVADKHQFYLNYPSYLIRSDGEQYKFRS